MKKFIALVLSLVMALSLCVPAWGATTHEVSTEVQLAELLDEDGTNDVAEGDTIKLLNSIEVQNAMHTSGTSTNGVSYTGGKSFTIDFNNCSVSADSSITNAIFRIKTSGTVTLMNGTITASDVYYGVLANGTGTINLDNMTISLTNTGGQGVAVNAYAGTVNINDGTEITATGAYAGMEVSGTANIYEGSTVSYVGNVPTPNTYGSIGSAVGTSSGTLNIYGGELVSTATGGNTVATNSSGGTINITGGTITGETAVFALTDSYYNNPAEINISGGTINGALAETAYGTASTEVVVKGGTFTDDVSDYVAAGVQQLPNGSVVPSSSIGDNTLSGNYFVKGTGAGAVASAAVVSVTDAKAPKDTDKDGLLDQVGNVKYFNIAGYTSKFVQVASVGEADMIVYYGNTDSVFAYLKAVASVEYLGTGVAFNNFGEKCGQYDDEPVAGTKYYLFQGVVYKTVTTSATNLMVGNTLTPVEAMADEFVDHAPAFTYDKDYKVVGVKCAKCGVPATLYANWAAIPKAAQADALALGDGRYYVWGAIGAAGTNGDKVQSAETFDAGIAMYVGMSVMAAAGSAVVLKKKD